ncbi:MAG: hypothetical protein IPO91_34370 [Chloroflexi bacterium]|nr:hypothetical protein [Chloroflexota bacterium]
MSDVSITAASVVKGANAKTRRGRAGATITAGQAVYEDSSDNFDLKLADANASAATANCVGIALHGASDGQPLEYVYEDDDFTPGGTLSLSAAADDGVYVLSGTAGGIAPIGDLASGMYPVIIGVAKSTTKMNLKIVRGTAALTA